MTVTSPAGRHFSNDLRYRAEHHPNQTAITPGYIIEPVRALLGGIALDPATTPSNPIGATRFYTPPTDGAVEPWDAPTIWVNPPYGKARDRWVDRCIQAGADGRSVVLLIPAHTDTVAFQRAASTAASVLLVKGRVKFGIPRVSGRQLAASHPSALLAWNVDLRSCGHLGIVLKAGAS